MKEIPLTQGKVALVDDEDYEWLNQWKWYVRKVGYNFYATRTINSKKIYMHREIMKLKPGDKREVDHRDRDGLNNQRYNLRVCSRSQNKANVNKQSNNTSGYKGVCWDKRFQKWLCRVKYNQKSIYIGKFNNKIDAAIAYNKKAKELFGEFAKLNNI